MKRLYVIIMLALTGTIVNAQNLYTVVGNGSNYYNGDSIQATSSGIVAAGPVALDKADNIYIADMYNNRIRKVDVATGIITTIAGTGTGGYNGDGIPATSAQIYYPMAVAVDTAGNVFFGDYSNNRVRRIDVSTGLISTIAGTGVYGYNGDNILGTNAEITEITGIAVDRSGNIYFSDLGNGRIRKIDISTGLIHNIAGDGTIGYNGDSIPAISAKLYNPHGIALDTSCNIYIADRDNNRIRKVDAATSIITTVAGCGIYGYNGDGIPSDSARFRYPNSVAVDDTGNIYISDEWNYMIHKVYKSTGLIYTIAGTGNFGFSPDGTPAVSALLGYPRGVAVDACGNVYISDYSNSRIRKIFSYAMTTSFTDVDCNGACNGTVDAYASGGTSPYTYSWSGGLGSGASHTNVYAGTYTVIVTDLNGCKQNLSVTISEPTAISIIISTTNTTCLGNGSASASVSGGIYPYVYSWPNGDTLSTSNGLSAGSYILTVTDANNCTATKIFTIINDTTSFLSTPICLVSVDSLSQHNIIVWDKTSFSNVDSFIVYREISTNNYQPITIMPYDSLSQFVDTVRTLYFPNTGDPNTGTYRYKIQVRDTCGRYSELSPFHNTIYFMNSSGIFTWPQLYTIENGFNPVASYILMRDDSSNGHWYAIGSVTGTQQFIIDPQYSQYQNTASWRIKTQWSITCSPTFKYLTSYNSSLSNIYTINTIGINENSFDNLINIYPNPATDKLYINAPQKSEIEILNIEGQLLESMNVNDNHATIDISDFAKGMYFVKVKNEKGIAVKKFVKE